MLAAVVDGYTGRRKARVGERPHGDAHRIVATFFGVEDRGPANRTEPEYEPRTPISDTDVLGGDAEDSERRGEARKRSEDAAGPPLACEAVAYTYTTRFAFDFNAQLSA